MSNEITKTEPATGYSLIPVQQIKNQAEQVKQLMASCMEENVHYGKIPGCGDKPTLLQPGAQKITMMFGVADTYDITEKDLPGGHREYMVKCTLVSKTTGVVQGSGVGLCSTMEKKYRYRNVADYEITDQPIPQDARERKQEYRKQGYGMKKVDGQWHWVKYKDSAQQENPDIADTFNTVLKMACKRSLIAATLNTFAVSDLFTQDIEDLEQYAIPEQQAAPQPVYQPQDNRKALWASVAEAKAQAEALGINSEGLQNWANVNFLNADGTPKAMNLYTEEEIARFRDYIVALIADYQTLQQPAQEAIPEEVYEPSMAENDIAF